MCSRSLMVKEKKKINQPFKALAAIKQHHFKIWKQEKRNSAASNPLSATAGGGIPFSTFPWQSLEKNMNEVQMAHKWGAVEVIHTLATVTPECGCYRRKALLRRGVIWTPTHKSAKIRPCAYTHTNFRENWEHSCQSVQIILKDTSSSQLQKKKYHFEIKDVWKLMMPKTITALLYNSDNRHAQPSGVQQYL